MRPVRLEMEGFTVFRQPVTVDFADANLFALSGPTGAGKTSIIDAITFALYGAVPRLDDRRAVAPVVSQNLTEARVRLDFSVGDTTYTAVRVVRATKTGATTKEARLQRGDEVLAGNADEVGTAVTDLLGLSFEHFTTCVSLPQGQFARFLHDKPRDRQDLLVRLLDLGLYDRVASAARQRAGLAASKVEGLEGQLTRLAEATPEALAAATERVAALGELAAALAAARPEIDALAEAARTARAAAEVCRGHVTRLEALRAPDDVAALAEQLTLASEERARLCAAEEAGAAALTEAEAVLADLPARADLEAIKRDLDARTALEDRVKVGEQAAIDAALAVDTQREAEQEADRARARCAEVLERLRIEHRAHALVPALREGEPCPVCRQPVAAIPVVDLPDLAEAEQALARAEVRLKRTTGAVVDAGKHQARVDETLTRLRRELDDVTSRLAAVTLPGTSGSRPDAAMVGGRSAAELDGTLFGGSTAGEPDAATVLGIPTQEVVGGLLEEARRAEAAVGEARKADRAARDALTQLDRRREELTRREGTARREFEGARDAVAVLGPPAAERSDLAADWQELVAWAEQLRPQLTADADEQLRAAGETEQQEKDRRAALADTCRAAGVEPPPPPTWPGEAVAAEHARTEQAVQRLEADMAEARRLRDEVASLTEQRQVAEALANHLAANRFEKWLLDEAVQRLAAGATEILAELTGGAYALAVDTKSGAFTVVDHANASQPRSARTLSGGETFLASLALALALADQVAELAAGGSARLESLFLDEGFGSLDHDTLDVVATALDELGARGRMVGVVTHVRELAERLPVRFEVRRAAGAASVERVEA